VPGAADRPADRQRRFACRKGMAAGRTVLAVYLYPDRRSGFRQYRDGTGRDGSGGGGAEPAGTGTYPVTKFRKCFFKRKKKLVVAGTHFYFIY